MKHYLLTLSAAVSLGIFAPCSQAITLTDTTFDIANYTWTMFLTNQTATVSTNATGGNPGSALQVSFQETIAGSKSTIYFLGNHLLYNPSTAGAITTISFSQDGYITSSIGVGSFFQTLLLYQNSTYYLHSVPISTVQGVFHTATANTLLATDFNKISNLSTGAVDTTSHPSFTSGLMQFGTIEGFSVAGSSHVIANGVERSDNLIITISAVPEPSTALLLAIGCVFVVGNAARTARRNKTRIDA